MGEDSLKGDLFEPNLFIFEFSKPLFLKLFILSKNNDKGLLILFLYI